MEVVLKGVFVDLLKPEQIKIYTKMLFKKLHQAGNFQIAIASKTVDSIFIIFNQSTKRLYTYIIVLTD